MSQVDLVIALADAYANHRMIDGAQDVDASQQSRNMRNVLEAAVQAHADEVEALKGRIEELEWDNKGIAEWRDEWQRMKEQRDQLCAERNSALAKLAALEG